MSELGWLILASGTASIAAIAFSFVYWEMWHISGANTLRGQIAKRQTIALWVIGTILGAPYFVRLCVLMVRA